MNTQHRGRAAFAVCGSFCTLGAAAAQAEQLVRQGWELLPVMSFAASRLDTRFGRASEWKERLEQLTGHPVLDSLQAVEPLGPKRLAEALVIAPCTGTTLARLAAGLSDTPVTLAALAGVAPAFDMVVNTIPAVVLTEPVLAALRPGSLIVDLASRPGGTDFAAARRLGLTALHALSLPAACAPETAGEFVAQTVCEILREREGSA